MYSDCIYKIVTDIVDNTNINSEETLFDLPCIIETIYSIIKDIYPEVKDNDYLLYRNILNIYIKYIKDYKTAPIIFIDSSLNDKSIFHKSVHDKSVDDKSVDDKLLDNKSFDNTSFDDNLPNYTSLVDKSIDYKCINDVYNNDKFFEKETIILDNIQITTDNNSFIKKKNKKSNDYDDDIKKSIIENGLNIKYSKIIELDSAEKQNIINNLERIKKIPQPIQRSPEWYSFRKEHITASDLSKITKKSESKERDLIINKCTDVPFKKITGKACEHGIKYEEVSCKIYEKRNK